MKNRILKWTVVIAVSVCMLCVSRWSFLSAHEEELVCGVCDEVIEQGEYIILGETVYHKRCFEQSPKCAVCSHPVAGEYKMDRQGRYYHPRCYEDTPKCALCGGPIIRGLYVRTEEGPVYHKQCYEKAPKCDLCQAPLLDGPVVELGRQRYHAHCYEEALKCDVCAYPIEGKYQIDIYSRNICSKHSHRPGCFICEYPVIKLRLNDGRGLCERCNRTAILNRTQAERLFRKVRSDLEREMGLVIDKEIDFHLINRKTLHDLEKGSSPSMLGKFLRKTKSLSIPLIGTKTISDEFSIYILYGLPRMLFASVAAHELTHAWQALHCRDDQSTEVKEGTAELMAYLYLQKRNEQIWMERIENNEETLYRESFEKAYSLYDKLGFNAFCPADKGHCSFLIK